MDIFDLVKIFAMTRVYVHCCNERRLTQVEALDTVPAHQGSPNDQSRGQASRRLYDNGKLAW